MHLPVNGLDVDQIMTRATVEVDHILVLNVFLMTTLLKPQPLEGHSFFAVVALIKASVEGMLRWCYDIPPFSLLDSSHSHE